MTTTNTNVLINFVLDRSGSMASVVDGTIEGVNALLDEQRNVDGQALLSLTLFDGQFDVRYVAQDLREVPKMARTGKNAYTTGGSTSLFDAVGTTIKGTEQWLANHPDWEGQVLTVILTDGEENTSTQWHVNIPAIEGDDFDVAQLIQYKQGEGWQFLFLGSGGSDWLERTFGHVAAHDAFVGYAHTSAANSQTYAGVARSMTSSRLTGAAFNSSSVIPADGMEVPTFDAAEALNALAENDVNAEAGS